MEQKLFFFLNAIYHPEKVYMQHYISHFLKVLERHKIFLVSSAVKMPSHGPIADDIVVKALQTLIGN